jgi:hypothetical protein
MERALHLKSEEAHTITYGPGSPHVAGALASARRSAGSLSVAPTFISPGIDGVAKRMNEPHAYLSLGSTVFLFLALVF